MTTKNPMTRDELRRRFEALPGEDYVPEPETRCEHCGGFRSRGHRCVRAIAVEAGRYGEGRAR